MLIDIREASSKHPTGKGVWLIEFVRALLSLSPDILLLTDRSGKDIASSHFPGAAILALPYTGIFWHLAAAFVVARRYPDAFYISPTSVIVPALVPSSLKTVLIVHDLIALQGGQHNVRAKIIEELFLRRSCKRAFRIMTVSRSTLMDLRALMPSLDSTKIAAIFAGPCTAMHAVHHSDGRTILHIGTLCPRKNQYRLLQAFALLSKEFPSRFRLVLVGGRGWNDDEIVALAQSIPGVEWRAYLPTGDARALLSTCAVFAFPSLNEGFGLPVLDALRAGVPVLTSAVGGLAEVAGDAALFVDPLSVASIRDGLRTLLLDTSLASRLSTCGPTQAAKYSWEKTAQLFLSHLRTQPYPSLT